MTEGSGAQAAKDRPLRKRLEGLYFGRSKRARAFRYGLLVFDIAIVPWTIFRSSTSSEPALRWRRATCDLKKVVYK